jgi:predicted DNA-binding transcriptional regulator AlpA
MNEKTIEALEAVVESAVDKALKNQFPTDPKAHMDRPLTAKYIGVTPRCLENWAVTGEGPAFVRLSARCVRYRKKDIDAWADSRLVSSTSEAVG